MNRNKVFEKTLKTRDRPMNFVGLALLILVLASTAQGAMYPEAKAIVLSENSNIEVTYEGSGGPGDVTGYNNLFGLHDPTYKELFWGKSTAYGTKFDLGTFPAYTELVFFIKSPAGTFLNGPAIRNPDNVVHAAITDIDTQTWRVGFEDMWNGGDRDFNDIRVLVKGDLYVIPPNPTKPDLVIMPGDISFSNSNPSSGKIIEIQANIHNLGSTTDKSIAVGFYDGDPENGGELIFNAPINGIGKEEVKTLNIAFDTAGKIGLHNIYVKADSLGQIDEIFETNNKAYQGLPIGNPQVPQTGIITAISTDSNNPPMYRGKTGTQWYPITISLHNPNDNVYVYQVGLKDDYVDKTDPSKGSYTRCTPEGLKTSTVSVTVPALGSSDIKFICMSDWEWIPEQKGFLENYMTSASKTLLTDLAQTIAGYNPLVSPVAFWIEFVDVADLSEKVQGEITYSVLLTSDSTSGITFGPGVNQDIKVGVPTIKWFLLGSSVFNKLGSSVATTISEASFKAVPNPISVGIWMAGLLSDQFAWKQYSQAYDPDFNYTSVQAPIPIHFSEMDTMPEGDVKKFVSEYADVVSLRNASFVAYVRYDGARIDNQSDYMLLQLEAANDFTLQAIQKMPEVVEHYKLFTVSMEPLTDEQIQRFREDIQANGLPQEQIDFLTRNGMGDNIENIAQVILNMDPELYRNPKNYTKFMVIQTMFLAYESNVYMSEIVRIKVEEKGMANTTASDADIEELEDLKSQINQSINQGTVTPETKALIDEMMNKSREVLDETNNLAYMPYYEFAVNALAILPTLDNAPPQIIITIPVNGTSYTLNQTVPANWQAFDPGSGIATVSATAPNGSLLDTSRFGMNVFTVNATDNSGNTASAQSVYWVTYKFTGPLPPFKSDGNITAKVGSTVPVKIQLQDANGNNVTNATVRIFVIDSSGKETNGTSAGNANTDNFFRQASDGIYMYNLKTSSEPGIVTVRIESDDEVSRYATIVLK